MGLPITKVASWQRYRNSNTYAQDTEWETYRTLDIDPFTFIRYNFGRFRNDVYKYGLEEPPYLTSKSIYLYVDGLRLIKVSRPSGETLDIEFRNEEVAGHFANSSEVVIGNRTKYREIFDKKFNLKNYYPSKYYFTWPFNRYVLVQPKSIEI